MVELIIYMVDLYTPSFDVTFDHNFIILSTWLYNMYYMLLCYYYVIST